MKDTIEEVLAKIGKMREHIIETHASPRFLSNTNTWPTFKEYIHRELHNESAWDIYRTTRDQESKNINTRNISKTESFGANYGRYYSSDWSIWEKDETAEASVRELEGSRL